MLLDLLIKMGYYSLGSPPDLTRGQRSTRLWFVIKYPLVWDLMLHPNNTKLLFLTLGLPLNQRHCKFEEHFSPSLLCGNPQTILLDKVWPKIINDYCPWHGHNISFPKFFSIAGSSCFYWTALSRKQSSHIRVKIQ